MEERVIYEVDQVDGMNAMIVETTNENRLKVSCYDGDWGNIWLDKNEVMELVDVLNLWLAEQE